MDDKVVDALAHALYAQGVTIDRWDDEQTHVRFAYVGQARQLLKRLNEYGYTVAELLIQTIGFPPEPDPVKATAPAPAKPTKKEEVISAEKPKAERSPAKYVRGTRKATERQADTSKEDE